MPEFTLEEIGEQIAETKKPSTKLNEIKLDGDEVPEQFRGKTAAEVIELNNRLQESLRMSEEARRSALALAETANRSAPPAPAPKPEEPKDLTQDELKQLMIDDPIRAVEVIQQQSERRIMRNLDTRLGSLASSSASTVKAEAQRRHAEEFQILGKEIEAFASTIPEGNLTNPDAWDDLVSYVVGKNRKKLAEYYRKTPAPSLEGSREREREDAGPSVRTHMGGDHNRSSAYTGKLTPEKMDPTMKEIARNLGQSDEDYCRNYNMGS